MKTLTKNLDLYTGLMLLSAWFIGVVKTLMIIF